MLALAAIWSKFLSLIPPTVDVILKHWPKFVIMLMMLIMYNQNFMTFQMFRWAGIQTVPNLEQKIKDKQNELNENKLDYLKLQAEYNDLDNLLSKMQGEVDQWAATSAELQQKHDGLLIELAKLKKQSESNVAEVLAGPTPDNCEAAIDYLKDAVGDLK